MMMTRGRKRWRRRRTTVIDDVDDVDDDPDGVGATRWPCRLPVVAPERAKAVDEGRLRGASYVLHYVVDCTGVTILNRPVTGRLHSVRVCFLNVV
jgi:hypothetical protein